MRALVHQSWFVDPIDVNDPPPIVIYHIPGVSDYVFFMRQDASSLNLLTVPDPKEKSAEELDEVTPHVVTGTIEVDLAVADSGQTEWAESLRSAFKRGEKGGRGHDSSAASR